MLVKMVLKMLFKATIPLLLVVGVSSYGMYMRGGDPLGMARLVLGGAFQSAKSSVQDAGESIQSVAPGSVASSKTTVYKWVDENGNTQFGSAPPEGMAAEAKTYNNNANLMTATKVQRRSSNDDQPATGMGEDGQPLPGVAGMNLPTSGDPEAMKQLLQVLQQAE